MPEGKEYDKLYRDKFQKRRLLGEVLAKLDVELDQAVHGNGDAYGNNDHHLKQTVRVSYHFGWVMHTNPYV